MRKTPLVGDIERFKIQTRSGNQKKRGIQITLKFPEVDPFEVVESAEEAREVRGGQVGDFDAATETIGGGKELLGDRG